MNSLFYIVVIATYLVLGNSLKCDIYSGPKVDFEDKDSTVNCDQLFNKSGRHKCFLLEFSRKDLKPKERPSFVFSGCVQDGAQSSFCNDSKLAMQKTNLTVSLCKICDKNNCLTGLNSGSTNIFVCYQTIFAIFMLMLLKY